MRPAHTLTTYRAVLTIDSKSRTRSSKSFVLSHTRGQFRGRGLFCQSLRVLPFCPPVGKRSHLSEIIYHRVAMCGVTIPLPRVLFPVGTLVSERPPDSSERAQFGHSA